MENKFAIVDVASALVDGAAFMNAMANRERDETSVERKVRLLIAQTQVELERLQAEASGDLFDMEIVN